MVVVIVVMLATLVLMFVAGANQSTQKEGSRRAFVFDTLHLLTTSLCCAPSRSSHGYRV